MIKNNNVFKWLYRYTKKQLLWVVFLSAISGFVSFGFIALALVSKKVLDIATGDITGSMAVGISQIVGIIIIQAILNILYANIGIRAVSKLDISIKQGLFNGLLKKKWRYVNKYHSGELLTRFTSDIDIVVGGVVGIIPQVISLVTRLVAGLAVLISINAKFTFIVFGLGIIVFGASKVYSKHFKYLHKLCQQADGGIRSFIQECIENLVVIKSFSNDDIVCRKLYARQSEAYKLKLRRNTVSNIANTGAYVIFTGSYYIALVWGAMQISIGVFSFGSLTAFLQIIEQIKAPMHNMSGLIPQYYSMIASAERIMELEDIEDEQFETLSDTREEIYSKMQAICFDNVSFSYEDESVLKEASCNINKGELVAIAGPSGIGKSTLVKLILGLIEVDEGRIYLETSEDNIKIDSGVRRLFAYVPQGNMILSGSIRENIAFCVPEASIEDIKSVSEIAMIWSFIEELPDGVDTVIGERGLGLSEGQIQRLAIARALLSGAPILLLDEATSALDEATEIGLLNNLKKCGDKTCIFISHKATTIGKCDRVINFIDKKLV